MKTYFADQILQVLKSKPYRDRLERLHVYYKNVKCEERYRDALLEELNLQYGVDQQIAYAKVDKVDLSIYDLRPEQKIGAEFSRYCIELKYQYTFDMAGPVANEMGKRGFSEILDNAQDAAHTSRTIAEKIVADCIDCDFFILIVQDRAGHPEGTLPGGVEANFIDDQRKLDRGSRRKPYPDWRVTTGELIDEISSRCGGRLIETIVHPVGQAPDPLTSHFFVLDMPGRRQKSAQASSVRPRTA